MFFRAETPMDTAQTGLARLRLTAPHTSNTRRVYLSALSPKGP